MIGPIMNGKSRRGQRIDPRVAFVVLAAILAISLTGCGLEGQPFSTDTTDKASKEVPEPAELGPAVVSNETIEMFPKSSPEVAALTWWRAVQTRDPDAVLESYSSEARDELPENFPVVLVTAIAPTAAQSAISIGDVEFEGRDKATLFVVIDSPEPRLGGPLAIPMKKSGDTWEITDPVYLGSLADTYIAAAKLAEKSAEDGGQ